MGCVVIVSRSISLINKCSNLEFCLFSNNAVPKQLPFCIRRFLYRFLIIVLFIFSFAKEGSAEKTVFWPLFEIPPLYIHDQEVGITGLGPSIDRYIQKKLPEYEHHNLLASPVRIMHSIREGKNWVATGAFKTKEREEFLYYSKYPCRLTWSMMGVIRKKDLSVMAPEGVLDIDRILDEGRFKFGYLRGVNYGSLNSVVDKFKTNSDSSLLPADFNNQFELLLRGRIDFFLADPLVVFYASQDAKEQIALVPCKDYLPEPLYGYFAVPKNQWGRKIMDRIDAVMKKAICSGRYRDLLVSWVPSQFKDSFERDYKKGFLEKTQCLD